MRLTIIWVPKIITCTVLLALQVTVLYAQYPASKTFRAVTVADGLPQSFVSGLVQDRTGFVWIGTRDGLARYDGRNFKVFLHKQGDTTTPASNIISDLFLDSKSRLWILYETGDIDVLNTVTETLLHFSKAPVFKAVNALIKRGHSITEDGRGNTWLLSNNGGVFIANLEQRSLRYYSDTALGLADNRITGINVNKGDVTLVTDQALITIDEKPGIKKTVSYRFDHPHLYDSSSVWKDNYALFRQNGQVIIQDEGRLIIYDAANNKFSVVTLPGEKNLLNMNTILDSNGQVLVAYKSDVYVLTSRNELTLWTTRVTNPLFGFKSILIDRSGLLWLGGNGSGIQIHNLHSPGFAQVPYHRSFHEDLLSKYLKVPEQEIAGSFLRYRDPYYFRWLYTKDDKVWLSKASSGLTDRPEICYYQNGHIIKQDWRYTDTDRRRHLSISAMATSQSGKLWGVDFLLRPVYFDTSTLTATVFPAIGTVNTENTYTANSLLIDGEDHFWVSTAFNGLFHYNRQTQTSVHYEAEDNYTSLPTNQLMSMQQDPDDRNVIWIGSIGGGLIKFDKHTGKCFSYTVADGLPNNTVYAVMLDEKGLLWCSSNKGIFSFDRHDGSVRSFTSMDGLPSEEFNRYHYFKLPDGRLSFGGIDGYTVFDPLKLEDDTFQPFVALTGISINNVPVDYGNTGSLFHQSINSLDEVVLNYNQNFISFSMAALQYTIPEKLQYRYMLEGYEQKWVYAGNNNLASYTKIPPGSYTLKINATNTAGKWSEHIKTLKIVIKPPFWRTSWFIVLVMICVAAMIYFLVHARIRLVRKEEQQKASFEKQAADLKAQALRAQMNPHFIFNCLNSIKSLIQDDRKQQAVQYLTTFSRLIRNQLNNAQQLISLHAELETCRLYTQLEALRFGSSINCRFEIQEDIDLFSLQVPPLIIQPFIENAIWHGILPKNGGNVIVSVKEEHGTVVCAIDDDGIGRAIAIRNKSQTNATYESKGMQLVKNRLSLYNIVNQSEGRVEVIDKTDNESNAAGTTIVITFNKEL